MNIKDIEVNREIFKDLLGFYEDKEYKNINNSNNIEKLKNELKNISEPKVNTVYKQGYELAKVGNFYISNVDIKDFMDRFNISYGENNFFKRYCHAVGTVIANNIKAYNKKQERLNNCILLSRYKNTTKNGQNKYYITLINKKTNMEERLLLINSDLFSLDKKENIIGSTEGINRFLMLNNGVKHIKL